jgi:hypothetical protein
MESVSANSPEKKSETLHCEIYKLLKIFVDTLRWLIYLIILKIGVQIRVPSSAGRNKNGSILWDITPCGQLKVNGLFGGKYRLHFQG